MRTARATARRPGGATWRRCRARRARGPRVERAVGAHRARRARATATRALVALHARASTACACAGAAARAAGRGPRAGRARADPARASRRCAAMARAHRGLPPPPARPRLPPARWPTARVLEEVRARRSTPSGLYVPGGAGAYPSSVLMNAIPARVAGVPRLVVVTPPRTLEANPAVAAALVVGRASRTRVYPRGRRAGRRRARLRHAHACPRWPRSSGPATPTWPRPSARCAAAWRSTSEAGPERGRDPGRRHRRRRAGWPPTCSPRPSTAAARRRSCWSRRRRALADEVGAPGRGRACRSVANRAPRAPRARAATARSCSCATSSEGVARRERARPRARRGA